MAQKDHSVPATHEDLTRTVKIKLSSDRTFGLVFATFFTLLGAFPLIKHGNPRWWALGISAGFLLAALIVPSTLHPLNLLAAKFSEVMHRFVAPVAAGAFFFLILSPFAMLRRLFVKDPLHLQFDKDLPTYWVTREKPGPAPESMVNQF